MKYKMRKFILFINLLVLFLLPVYGQKKKHNNIKMQVEPHLIEWDGEKPLQVEVILKNNGRRNLKLNIYCENEFSFVIRSEKNLPYREDSSAKPLLLTLIYGGKMKFSEEEKEPCEILQANKFVEIIKARGSRKYRLFIDSKDIYGHQITVGLNDKPEWKHRPDGRYELEVRYSLEGKTLQKNENIVFMAKVSLVLKRKS